MKENKILGWSIIFLLAIIPILLLMTLGEETSWFGDYSSATQTLGEIFGLVGMTLFALTFVLSTRIKAIEDLFGGLDKVYIVHAIVGGAALVSMLFHPIFLVLKFIPSDVWQAALYLLPGSYWSVNFGIIALMGLIFLISLTLYSSMKYNRWKFSHEFLGLVFLFAVFHIFLVRGNASRDNIFVGYYEYAAAVSIIGLGAFSYSLFLKNRIFKTAVYRVRTIKPYKNAFEISMVAEHKPLQYKAGQFIFVRFYNRRLPREAHPFSIASETNSPILTIIVKKLGDFTSKLIELREGDKVSIEGPYGKFDYTKAKGKNQVWIAGGIGIVPFLGMAKDLEDKTIDGTISLFYSVADESDFIGYDLLTQLSSANKKFSFIAWNSKTQGYLDAKKIQEISGSVKDKAYFLCGPPGFKDSIIKGLLQLGVKKQSIHEEAFDFR